MDVYGSTSLTAWTVVNIMQRKSAARVKDILKGAGMFTRFRDTDFVRRSHCVNGVLRTVSKGCKNSPKRTKCNYHKPDGKEEVQIDKEKKIYNKK